VRPPPFEDGVELADSAQRLVAEVDRFDADGARGLDVVAVVVDEDARRRRHAEPFARQQIDARVGLPHADLTRVHDHLEQVIDWERRSPRRTELLDVVRQQTHLEPVASEAPDPVHHRPVDAERHVAGELLVGVEVDFSTDHLRCALHDARHVLVEADLAHLEAVPVVGDGGGALRDGAVNRVATIGVALSADVRGLAEDQFQDRAGRVAHVGLEAADTAEQRTRDHTPVVPDDRFDRRVHEARLPMRATAGRWRTRG
jgi:hypothetical protein